MNDEIRAVLDKPEYRGLFASSSGECVFNQRLAAHGVNAKITSIRKDPLGGVRIDYSWADEHGSIHHDGWDTE